MDQTIILVDDRDKFKGYTTWRKGHLGRGRRHRGFVVLLFDEQGNVYLQKRKHRVFDGLWDLTAISHPYKVGKKEESLEEAALRSLKNEMGIGKVKLTNVGAFVYFVKDGDWCENEYCYVLVGKFDGKFKPNKQSFSPNKKYVYDAKKIPFEEFVKDIRKNPREYTPWARETVKLVRKVGDVGGVRGKELLEDWGKFKKEFEKYYTAFFRARTKEVKKHPTLITRYFRELEDFGSGGKRLRPYLVWLGYRLSQSRFPNGKSSSGKSKLEQTQILPVCLAVELAHMGFMIHDDVMDRSGSRHNKPTMHKRFEKGFGEYYGLGQAMLTGDLAFFEAFRLLGDEKEELLKVWVMTCFGQGLDLFYGHQRPRFEEVLQVMDLKTAKYTFEGPLVCGFVAGLGTGPVSSFLALQKFALVCGRAYQLRDDILGVFGEEKVTGKSPLSDMREGKNTLLVLKAKELGSMSDRQIIDRIWGKRDGGVKEIGEIREIIAASGALEWCEVELMKLVGEAEKQTRVITKDANLLLILRQMANYAAKRDF